MPVPLAGASAGGDNFGTMLRSSRLNATGVGMPDDAKVSSGFSISGFAASDRAATSCAS
jgi:hypothetical protein